jgi:phosphoglycerate dehydrogenase-like enzyme
MKLLIPQALAPLIEPRLAEMAPDLEVVRFDNTGEPEGDVSDVTMLLRWWTPVGALRRVLAAAPNLRWIHTPSAGVEHLLIPEILERDIVLTNSAGAHAIPIAEFVLMYMLNHVKRAFDLKALAPAEWERGDDIPCDELFERTLLIIGYGNIGAEVAKRARAFGMRILASRRRPQPADEVDLMVGEHGWRDLLPQADYVVIATPLTAATRGMFDADAFRRMKSSAYLINIARGQIVDTDALLEALHSGRIAGAALDALPVEPLPPDHPLWKASNVWITPHISYSSPRTRERMIDLFFENLRRYLNGESLLNVVDKDAGY